MRVEVLAINWDRVYCDEDRNLLMDFGGRQYMIEIRAFDVTEEK